MFAIRVQPTTTARIVGSVAAVAAATIVGFTPSTASAAANLPVVLPVMKCADLLNVDFSSVPEGPIRIMSATESPTRVVIGAGPFPTTTTPAPNCDVVFRMPSQLQTQIQLPLQNWTQRFVMTGCGDTCGRLEVQPNIYRASFNCPSVLSGELVFAETDLGHQPRPGPLNSSSWAEGNPGAVIDFFYTGMQKSVRGAKAVLAAFYGQPAKFNYYFGCSDGGREGLEELQRFPTEFDGAIIGAPVVNNVEHNVFWHGWNYRKNIGPDGNAILTSDKIPALHAAVLAACGMLNGAVGDYLNDPRACNFDARTLICPGADSPSCLTAAQANVANLLYQGAEDGLGNRLATGGMPKGSELQWVNYNVLPAGHPMSTAPAKTSAWDYPLWLSSFDVPTGVTADTLQFTSQEFFRMTLLAGAQDPTNSNLSAFKSHGGKLLMWSGWWDIGVAPENLLSYYGALQSTMGPSVNDFVAVYMVPGMYHCGGNGPEPVWQDFLTPMIDWVESGIKPDRIVSSYLRSPSDPTVVKTRPNFPYPNIARYTGTGDINVASSYVKSAPDVTFDDNYAWLGSYHFSANIELWCGNAPIGGGLGTTFKCGQRPSSQ